MVTEGTVRGTGDRTTLFHSFETFSPAQNTVLFDLRNGSNHIDTRNINRVIGRVTGTQPSWINGTLGIEQDLNATPADLFLINPQGISFGPNANLSLPGSFWVSTAQAIRFNDGAIFSATSPKAAPLLHVNTPIGLQMGAQASPISVNQSVLNLNPGKTLSFLGGNVQVQGAEITLNGGTLDIGAVSQNTEVLLDPKTGLLDYSDSSPFKDISLKASRLNMSGDGGGQFHVRGRHLEINEENYIEASNLGRQDATFSSLWASDSIVVDGAYTRIFLDVYGTGRGNQLHITAPNVRISNGSWVATDSFGEGSSGGISAKVNRLSMIEGSVSVRAYASGHAGDLTIKTGHLEMLNGFQIASGTSGDGHAGSLEVMATEAIEIKGHDRIGDGLYLTGFIASAEDGSSGDAGDIKVTTPKLTLDLLSQVASSAHGSGKSGNIKVKVGDLTISNTVGETPFDITGIVADVLDNATGSGGIVDIEADKIRLLGGGQINTSTNALGNAGLVKIRANQIEIAGRSENGIFPSAIASSSSSKSSAGSVNILGQQIQIWDEGEISVSSVAGGNAGNLDLVTDILELDQGRIDAEVTAGNKGNLNLTANRRLILKNQSAITTSATGSATGGNINLRSPVIVGWGNSDIRANAVLGDGGNISIESQGLFGLKNREQLTTESDISASSKFGFSGNVTIHNLSDNANQGLVVLPEQVRDAKQEVAQSCAQNLARNHFAFTKEGGLPISPLSAPGGSPLWQDTRSLAQAAPPSPGDVSLFQEATGWSRNSEGKRVLVNPTLAKTMGEVTACS